MILTIDFDGTIVMHDYPDIGAEVPFAFDTMKKLINKGHKLILYTMRCGKELEEAIEYCEAKGIHFYDVNHNPIQHSWTSSPKVYAHYYIGDDAIGCPLIKSTHKRVYVDWEKIQKILIQKGVI